MRLPSRFFAALALATAAAGCRSPTEPAPGQYTVVFLGTPADAETFAPRAVVGRRVYGTASGGGATWPVVWSDGTFARLVDFPADCQAEPREARGGAVVGIVVCPPPDEAAGPPDDAFGWGIGPGVPAGRVVAEPHAYQGVSPAGVVGTIQPRTEFPLRAHRAFRVAGGGVEILLPPGAEASEAAGIATDGTVGATSFRGCTAEGCAESRVAVLVGGGWTEVPLPNDTDHAVAVAVSSAGHVLGFASGAADAVFVHHLGRTRVLPRVPGTQVVLNGVNARGWVVGTGARPVVVGRGQSAGIIWGRDRQYFLSERVVGRTWEVTAAEAIDDEDFIAGAGIERETGLQGAILLVPLGR
jgi:hypothetical protein